MTGYPEISHNCRYKKAAKKWLGNPEGPAQSPNKKSPELMGWLSCAREPGSRLSLCVQVLTLLAGIQKANNVASVWYRSPDADFGRMVNTLVTVVGCEKASQGFRGHGFKTTLRIMRQFGHNWPLTWCLFSPPLHAKCYRHVNARWKQPCGEPSRCDRLTIVSNRWFRSTHVSPFWRMGHSRMFSTLTTAVIGERCLWNRGFMGA